jgi:hypothetical protein
MAQLQVLVVVDGSSFVARVPGGPLLPIAHGFNLAASDPSDQTFTIDTFVKALEGASISVTKAHRRNDPNAIPQFQDFVFSAEKLAGFDVLWMFGYEGNNDSTVTGNPISPAELLAITNFMTNGGGVFASGDHSGLGAYMCGLIPRVRTMRKWFGQEEVPATYPPEAINWPGPGVTRADTLALARDMQWEFDNQSDDVPQTLHLPVPASPHPILVGQNGTINAFPDHMHEGEVILPWTLTDTLSVDGKKIVEYPSVAGHQEVPSVIARGQVYAHPTNIQRGSCDNNNFSPDLTSANERLIDVLCVYDGHNVGVGRIITDSSFHHYIDLNLTGDPCGGPGRTQGFQTTVGEHYLAEFKSFYVNAVNWLAPVPLDLLGLELHPTTVALGAACTGTVTMSRGSPQDNVVVKLACQPPGFVGLPASITIPPNTNSAEFNISIPKVIRPFGVTEGLVQATFGTTTKTVTLTLEPGSETGVLATLVVHGPVVGGNSTTGLVSLVKSVTTPTVVSLAVSQTVQTKPGSPVILPQAHVEPSLTIPAGHTGAAFTITTDPLPFTATDRTVNIDANAFVTKVALLRFS